MRLPAVPRLQPPASGVPQTVIARVLLALEANDAATRRPSRQLGLCLPLGLSPAELDDCLHELELRRLVLRSADGLVWPASACRRIAV